MKRILTLNLLWLAALPIAAQSYMDKAERFSYDTLNPLVLNDYASVEWQENGSRYFSYRVESPRPIIWWTPRTGAARSIPTGRA